MAVASGVSADSGTQVAQQEWPVLHAVTLMPAVKSAVLPLLASEQADDVVLQESMEISIH